MNAESRALLDYIDEQIAAMERGEITPREVQELIARERDEAQAGIAAAEARKLEMLVTMPALRREIAECHPNTRGLPLDRLAKMRGLTLKRRTPRLDRTAPLPRAERRTARRREVRSGRRHVTRGSPEDPDPEHAPGDDTPVNVAWQALLDTLTADWQYRHIAKLCLLRSRWLRRWWR